VIPTPPRPDLGSPGLPVPPEILGRPLATWRWWEAIGVVVGAFILGSIATIPIYLIFGDTRQGGASGASELAQSAVLDLALLAVLIGWLSRWHPTWRPVIGFPAKDRWVREVAIGAGLGLMVWFAATIAAGAILATLNAIGNAPVPESLPDQISSDLPAAGLVVFALLAVVIAPVTEEFIFRGLLFRAIRDRRGFWPGAIVSALLFGLVHYLPDNPWRSVVALQAVMVFTGLGLAFVYEKRRNIVANMAGHAAFNSIAVFSSVARALHR
jgi:membrane protease YdiL (CAAX protease family)